MSRALLGAALLLSGCSLLVSVDGLTGGPAPRDEPDGGSSGITGRDGAASSSGSVDATTDGTAATSRYAQEVLADRPSIYLRFGDAAGTSAVKNEVGALAATYPLDVTLGTPGAIAGDPDTAITFNGGILELPPGQECAGTSDCVVELWVRIDEIQSGYAWVLDHQLWDPRGGWLLETQDGAMVFERWAAGSGAGSVGATDRIEPKIWHHVVAAKDANGYGIYYDGVQAEHHPTAEAIPATNAVWTVGGIACTTCGDRLRFKGAVDELAVYEHGIGETRIKAHYAAGQGK